MSQPLTSVTAVKAYLGVAGIDDDALLTDLIARASDAIVAHCGRAFAAADYDEYHDGDGSDIVLLDQRPVISVSALSEDDDPVDADDFVVYPELGIVRLKSGVFGRGARNVRVAYRAGYETIPADVEQGAIEWVAAMHRGCGESAGREVSSERVGDYAVTYERDARDGMPAAVRVMLEPYRVVLCR
jgi:hypothetical protein